MTSPLLQTLRRRTADIHGKLDADLDLLRPPLSQSRLRTFLERLHGFHRAWGPAAVTAGLANAAEHETEGAVARLRNDLLALGGEAAEIDALPICHDAAGLTATPDGALGALYVVEGSALGGVVIGRALADAGWPPLSYFDVEGRRASADWRALQVRLAETSEDRHPAVTDGAVAAFALMSDWLSPARPAA